ncbi:MAG: homoserine O-acetyltransferase MetX [Gammaproteobacteria bacterium]
MDPLTPQPQYFELPERFKLESGQTLTEARIIYETYGTLSKKADNAILICHALTGNHHAAGQYPQEQIFGWWNAMIGPGKAIDTSKFFILCANNLGGCHGSTGPNSPMPGEDTAERRYGRSFPQVSVQDWVRSQQLLATHLNINRFHAVIGGSLGGMQALQWAISFPDQIERCIAIASTASLSAQNLAFNVIARKAIELSATGSEPKAAEGLGLARMLGHITYLSEHGMSERFGREKMQTAADNRFTIQSYLEYQAKTFVEKGFDANTYLLMSHVLDQFDLAAHTHGDLVRALEPAVCDFLLISFDSDWRFPPARSKELVTALIQAHKPVSYLEFASEKGHDAFLFALPPYQDALRTFLDRPQTLVVPANRPE